jgi:O-antigen/teichoic acid export membrane protein
MTRSVFLLTAANLLVLVMGLGRAKVNAHWLGVAGIGLVAQLNTLCVLLGSFAMVGLATAGVKSIAAARGRGDLGQARDIAAIVMIVPLGLGTLIAIAVTVASPGIASLVTGTTQYWWAVSIAVWSIPLSMGYAALVILVQSETRMGLLSRLILISAAAQTVAVVVLVVAAGLFGAVVAVALTSLISLVIGLGATWHVLRRYWPPRFPQLRTLQIVRGIATASFVVGGSALLVDMVIRTRIVHVGGLNALGLYQPAAFVSVQAFGPFIAAVGTYLLPTLSSTISRGDFDEAAKIVKTAVRLSVGGSALGAIGLGVAGRPFLRLLFAPSFEQGFNPLLWQLAGEPLWAASWGFGALLLPLGLTRQWLLVGVITAAVQVSTALALPASLGAQIGAISFTAAWAACVIVTLFVLGRQKAVSAVFAEVPRIGMAVVAVCAALVVDGVAPPELSWLFSVLAAVLVVVLTVRLGDVRMLWHGAVARIDVPAQFAASPPSTIQPHPGEPPVVQESL